MRRFIILVLAFSVVLSIVVVPNTCASTRTYGIDNLNNNPGDLVIGFLGGSITEGSGSDPATLRYSTQLINRYFKTKYPSKNVIERNAGIGGTPSDFGMFRMRRDLGLDSDKSPDVVFVEFAVNDSGTCSTPEGKVAVQTRMEGIVRQLMDLPKQPVVIFIYTTQLAKDNVTNAVAAHHAIAEHYGIGELNLHEYIWSEVDKGSIIWAKNTPGSLTVDGTHPNNQGYTVYADYMINCFNNDFSKYFKKISEPELPYSDYVFGKTEIISHTDSRVTFSDGWTLNTTDLRGRFPDGFKETTNGVGKTVTFKFTGRSVAVGYARGKDGGTFNYVIKDNGGNIETQGKSAFYYPSGLMVEGRVLATNLPYGEHTLTLTGEINNSAVTNTTMPGTGTYFSIGYFMIESDLPVIRPVAKALAISGDGEVGKLMKAAYEYRGSMFNEGSSVRKWMIADSENGAYTDISASDSFTPSAQQIGKYAKFSITPVNSQGTHGDTVYSQPFYIKRPMNVISLQNCPMFRINGVAQSKLNAGTGVVSVALKNSGELPLDVTLYLVGYSNQSGFKTMSGVTKQTKTIAASSFASYSFDATIDSTHTYKLVAISNDCLEPIVIGEIKENDVVCMGTEDGTTIYKIDYLNVIK